MSGEMILLGCIGIGLVCIVLFAHWIDRRIVRKIEAYEERMVDKGVYKRHFTEKGKN
mgnify:CR=1 FL=1